MKKFVALLLCFNMALSTISLVGCNNGSGEKEQTAKNSIVLSESFQEDLKIDYKSDVEIPTAIVEDKDGNEIQGAKVKYIFVTPKGEEKQSDYPTYFCEELGTWKVKYVYENVVLEYSFTVMDVDDPVVTFGALPSDVKVGDKFIIPAVDYEDSSGINEDKTTEVLYFDNGTGEKEVTGYNPLTKQVEAKEFGTYTFKVDAYDNYDRHTHAEESWIVKDPNWEDPDLPEGMLADFSKKNYLSYSKRGFINSYWDAISTKEYYVDSYEGCEGVLKSVIGWNASGHTVIQYQLKNGVNLATQLQNPDDVVIFKVRVDDTNTNELLYLSTSEDHFDANLPMGTCVSKSVPMDIGRWFTVSLTKDEIKKYGFVSESETVFDSFQFGFVKDLNPEVQGADMTFYIDSISYGKQLPKATGFSVTNKVLTWQAVENATGYLVYDGDQVEMVTTPQYTLKTGDAVVKVKVLGDGVNYADSEVVYSYDFVLENKVLSDFSCAQYGKLVGPGLAPYQGAKAVTGQYLSEFEGKQNVLRVTTTANKYGYADFVVNLPYGIPLEITDFEWLYIEMFIPSTVGNQVCHSCPNQYGTKFQENLTKGEWITIKVNRNQGSRNWALDYRGTINRLQFGLNGLEGTTESIYFSKIWYE